MEQLIKYKALITKTKDLNGSKTATIQEGQNFNAWFTGWPEIGKSFIFYEISYKFSAPIHTTEVLEIIDEKTFRTKNSIYTIYTIEQQRDEKIDDILN